MPAFYNETVFDIGKNARNARLKIVTIKCYLIGNVMNAAESE